MLKEVWEGRILLCPFEEQGTYSVLDSGAGRGEYYISFAIKQKGTHNNADCLASWICDIASQLSPLSDLQGIDIKDNNFPHELPSNVSLSINSVLSLPDDWDMEA